MNRRSFIHALGSAGTVLLAAGPGQARTAPWTALRQPGALAIMRHANAPGTGDPSDFTLGDCATQRNLDVRGQDQARATGAALRDNGIRFDRVMSSRWCRCQETARLMQVGPVEDLPSLDSFFENRAAGPRQTRETLAFIDRLPSQERVLLVTHQVNITALTNSGVASGELFALRRGDRAPLDIIGAFLVR